MDRILTIGSTGPDVSQVQGLLNRRPPTLFPPLKTDGVFGPKTAARVKEFQRNNGLKIDGLVGPKTLGQLRGASVAPRTGLLCDNPDPANLSSGLAIRNSLVSSGGPIGQVRLAAFSFPGVPAIRSLTAFQINTAKNTYGGSLDFSRIFITDRKGAGGRPFTIAVTTPVTGTIQVMNCGTFTPDQDTLIHELAHVWQSQHHSSPTQFITNAVSSQAAAVAANGLEVSLDRSVAANADFPVHFPFSAYVFTPGKTFGEYAAEQIANAVEHGDGAIIAHVRSVGVGVVDGANVTSLATSRIGDRRTPGVVF